MLYWDQTGHTGMSGLFSLIGDDTFVDGTKQDVDALQAVDFGYQAQYKALLAKSKLDNVPEGLLVRDDSITNTSNSSVTLRRALSRFAFQGNEYEVCTQYSGWINESRGAWQPLTTTVMARSRELRPTENAAPMLAIWNRQTRHGMVFHLFSNCAWMLCAQVVSCGQESVTVIDLGMDDSGLQYTLSPEETCVLPRILAIPFTDRESMGSDILHRWFHRVYPRRSMPVICNSWMMTFDRIDMNTLPLQVERAAQMGAEYFVIDAGWFGNDGRWFENIGAWEENQTGAFAGRMREFSDMVRKSGMKFGLWLEVERALGNVKAVKEHPEWFFFNGNSYLLNFGCEEALAYITDTVIGLIDRYDIAFIKSDFNDSISYDPTGTAFRRWHDGHERYIRAIRAHKKDIYLENCAPGGQRMDLYDATLFDSCWISDNHSPYDETRILKETLLRLPPCAIEKWPVLKSADGFISYDQAGTMEKLIACNDATWHNVVGINEDWLRAYVAGGVLGFSFDLLSVSEHTRALMTDVIREYKENRDFYARASAVLLCNTEAVTAIQYADDAQMLIMVFIWRDVQRTVTLYPESNAAFSFNGKMYCAGEAITISNPGYLHAATLRLKKL